MRKELRDRKLRWLLLLLLAVGVSRPAMAVYSSLLDVPPRQQWDANYGYCGETSLIGAGLYYGQYLSQYEARALASPNTSQASPESQLLLGVNEVAAARRLHLKAVRWQPLETSSSDDFLAWVKGMVLRGAPVVIGVYANQYRFFGKRQSTAGDAEYDHIVTVYGVASNHPLTRPAVYYPDDILRFEDHGEWTATRDGLPQYRFSYGFAHFGATRAQANLAARGVYSLPSAVRQYGLAVTGILDGDGKTLPVRLDASVNHETPVMREGSNQRPAPLSLVLTVTVSGLTPGVVYRLYRYSAMAAVPDGAFNANAGKAAQVWEIKLTAGAVYKRRVAINSNETAVFRAVPASAP